MMGYQQTLERVAQLRAMTGAAPQQAPATSPADSAAFAQQLALQQAQLTGLSSDTPDAEQPLSQFGVPILTVADQYRMLGMAPPTTSGIGGPLAGGPAAQRMVQLAQAEIGVSETGGNNESPRIREYRTATAGAENTPGPWCAYFVSWLAKEAGAPIGAGGNGTGYVPTLKAWAQQEDRYSDFGTTPPKPGDIVIFDWTGDGVADHTGIVERVEPDGTVHTIEGNASDKVMRREYSAGTNDIDGYVRMS
jgi:uncharacterized protein (TIGR02594 family)